MHSRLQELKKEEETLLKIKVMLQDQLNRLKVNERGHSMGVLGIVSMFVVHVVYILCVYSVFQFEEGALKSIINAQTEEGASSPETEVNHQREHLGTTLLNGHNLS